MYKRNAQGWSKHFDFFVIDEISLQIAFYLAVLIRQHEWSFASTLYRSLGILLILVDAFVLVINNSMHNVISRGYYLEAKETVKHCFIVFAVATIYMFATQSGDAYSRIVLFLTFLFHLVCGYGMRLLWKRYLEKHNKRTQKKSRMLVVVSPESADTILERLAGDKRADYQISGVVFTKDTDRGSVAGYPVVARIGEAADYIVREWIDSVYIDASLTDENVVRLMDDCSLMAIPTHFHVPNMSRNGEKRFSEKIGGTTVLTTSINYATPLQAFIKRSFDIIAGIFGSLVALLIMAIVGPIIKRESPGPILFKQERIGQNGRRFKIYKIRSMYMDAEARKKDLLEQNRVKDGMMFKLDFDPRIIGNVVLPDGTQKTGIGDKIRRYSLA